MASLVKDFSLLSTFDIDLFKSGKHYRLYEKLGSHPLQTEYGSGAYFAVYAPAAKEVQVIGDFNNWSGDRHGLKVRWDDSGIWEGFIPDIYPGELYKYRIYSHQDDLIREKADPYARRYEMPPKSASIVWKDSYDWQFNNTVVKENALDQAISIYEVHIGSWKKNVQENRSLHYREIADQLVDYLVNMNFTHVEFLPLMEHPYYPSWGYLCTGYFAPTSRYGNPDDLRYLIDRLHQANIGVILDWVPAHFPNDEHALADFDGSCVYEHPDKSKGFHPDWNSLIFNYERPEVRSFLLSSAHFWLSEYKIDGLRVDAVASMLYLDYSREEEQWTPNKYGNNEYLAAIDFLKELNVSCYKEHPHILMIAEESTAFYGVTTPVHHKGLGFGLKWMMGWMNDALEYFQRDPIHRTYHHNDISRSLTYAFSENYVLPLSHDEVVHGKKSLLDKMSGDEWQKFANLRLLYLCMYTHPGQKLLFMGGEFGQSQEWNVDYSLDWDLLQYQPHKGLQKYVADLNRIYCAEESLYAKNYSTDGFEWIEWNDAKNCVTSFIRKGNESHLLIVLNFSTNVHQDYRIGIPDKDNYQSIISSDDQQYYGSGIKPENIILSDNIPLHNRANSVVLTLPPLGGLVLKPTSDTDA